MINSITVRKLELGWDRKREALVFIGTLDNGMQYEVAFPIGHVSMTFDTELEGMGYIGEPIMGDIESIDGFFSRLKHAVSSVAHTVTGVSKKIAPKFVQNAYNRTIKRVANQAIHYGQAGIKFAGKAGLAALRSKQLGTLLGGAALVFPGIGGAALAAWAAGNRIVALADEARHDVNAARQLVAARARLATMIRTGHPDAGMVVAGLKSVSA